MDRLPGRLADGPRLRGPVRPHAERSLRLAPAGADLPRSACSTGAARGGSSTSTCSSCSRSAISQIFFNAGDIGVSVPLAYPPLALPARAHALDRLPRAGRGAAPVAPVAWLGDRGVVPARLSGGAQHRRLRRHRRRLRGRDRRRPHHPRRAGSGATARSPTTTASATPTAPSTTTPTSRSSSRCPGAATGTSCRPRTPRRSSSTWRRVAGLFVLGRRAAAGRAGRGSASLLALRLGSPTRTPTSRCSRTPTTRWSRRCSSGRWRCSRSAARARRPARRSRRWPSSRPLALAPLSRPASAGLLASPRSREPRKGRARRGAAPARPLLARLRLVVAR